MEMELTYNQADFLLYNNFKNKLAKGEEKHFT